MCFLTITRSRILWEECQGVEVLEIPPMRTNTDYIHNSYSGSNMNLWLEAMKTWNPLNSRGSTSSFAGPSRRSSWFPMCLMLFKIWLMSTAASKTNERSATWHHAPLPSNAKPILRSRQFNSVRISLYNSATWSKLNAARSSAIFKCATAEYMYKLWICPARVREFIHDLPIFRINNNAFRPITWTKSVAFLRMDFTPGFKTKTPTSDQEQRKSWIGDGGSIHPGRKKEGYFFFNEDEIDVQNLHQKF